MEVMRLAFILLDIKPTVIAVIMMQPIKAAMIVADITLGYNIKPAQSRRIQ